MNYTATELAKKLDISRSNLYYLKERSQIQVSLDQKGHPIWNDNVYQQLTEYIEEKKKKKKTKKQALPYRTFKINNRRYLGNKYKLLSFIRKVVGKECKNITTVADIFAGTGAVASAFTDKKVITNDILYSNYICHMAWFAAKAYDRQKVIDMIQTYNQLEIAQDNYMSKNFANTYFSLADCRKIGYIREDIELQFQKEVINEKERALLITSLLYAMDKIANTCGHYDAYRQGAKFERSIELLVPSPEENLNENNVCYHMDTNELVKDMAADLVYIDPPYNSRQYCDAYHLLENVARWEKPNVYGVAKKMDRKSLKSAYCTKNATKAFEELIDSIQAKYIILSYNNMAEKGNERSNAKISDEDILRILKKKGTVKIFSESYKAFSTGKSDIQENEERLFLCKCKKQEKEIIPSPLNYTGGKFKLLPQLLPQFPKTIHQVVDLFCGGCNVGININCNKVLFNDANPYLMGLIHVFQKRTKEEIFSKIHQVIEQYGLSKASEYGYDHYGCISSDGLGSYNKEPYLKLREDFNSMEDKTDHYYIMLYVIIIYSFNNQIRFNKRGEFNLPVGKRDFNPKMQQKLTNFIDRIKNADYTFSTGDFRKIDISNYKKDTFFYVDPPYLITCATYNEQNGWNEKDEKDLLAFLDELDRKGIKFALSNVLESRGRKNEILDSWAKTNKKKYHVIDLDYNYSNSNYQLKDKQSITREVLIKNY